MTTRSRGVRPANDGGTVTVGSQPPDYNQMTPRFCLAFLAPDYNLQPLDREARAAFALALQKRSTLTWGEINRTVRHELGFELLPADGFIPRPPVKFENVTKFMVFRYHGLLPMAGHRIHDTFHVLWIERQFGDLYDHGP